METTAIRLKRALEIRGLKQIELSEKTGIGRSAISQYLSGKVTPKQDKIYLIATALKVSPGWLMGVDVPMESADEYYDNPETAEMAEKLRTNEGLRMLFKASADLDPDKMKEAYSYVKYLKSKEPK